MEKEDFEKLVEEGINRIPGEFLAKLENVAIVVDDEPNHEQLQKAGIANGGRTLLGLYEGVPQTKRGPHYGFTLPDKITIFQGPIERLAASDEQIKEMVCDTVWHEIAHHFGMDEDRVSEAQKKRKEKENA